MENSTVVRNEVGEDLFDSVDLDPRPFHLGWQPTGDAPCPTASWVGSDHDEELWICVSEMIKEVDRDD